MVGELKTLVLTPDFPPAVGGIQTVVHRVVQHAGGLQPRVVTLRHEHGADFDAGLGFTVHRVRHLPLGYRATVGLLNASAVKEALRFRPQAILSGHIVMAPAAATIRRLLRVPVAQYLHGYELAARPGLTSFAVRHADANIAVSRYTRELAIAAGAVLERVHVIPNGADPEEATPEQNRARFRRCSRSAG
jgi:phosphatidylinositol alpha-1,6-mannosyltransferase